MSFAALLSFDVVTLAVLTTVGAAVIATVTFTVIGGKAPPAGMVSVPLPGRVQVTVCPVTGLQVHPVLLAPVAVRPAGNVSVMVTVSVVGPAAALFLTFRVNVPV